MGTLEWQLTGRQGRHQTVTFISAQAVIEFDGTCLMCNLYKYYIVKPITGHKNFGENELIYHGTLGMLAP